MGVEPTRPSLVSRALKLNIGEPVNLAAWNEARRRLYETGAFRSVDIEREIIAEPVSDPRRRPRGPSSPCARSSPFRSGRGIGCDTASR